MPKIHIDQQPGADQAPQAAAQPAAPKLADVITDAAGRRITLKKPPVLQQYNVILAVGPEAARNETWMQMVNPLLWVTEIDGDPVRFPRSKAEVDALIQRLDEHGVETVLDWVMQQAVAAQQAASSQSPEVDAAKNSPGTPNS